MGVWLQKPRTRTAQIVFLAQKLPAYASRGQTPLVMWEQCSGCGALFYLEEILLVPICRHNISVISPSFQPHSSPQQPHQKPVCSCSLDAAVFLSCFVLKHMAVGF